MDDNIVEDAELERLLEDRQGLKNLENYGLPREVSEILLKKDQSFRHLDFKKSEQEIMIEIAKWFSEFNVPYTMSSDPTQDKYWIEFAGKVGKKRIDDE